MLIRVRDGAFASRLLSRGSAPGVRSRVLAVLRWQRRLDAAIDEVSRRPVGSLDATVAEALRIGVAEVVVLGVPAAVAGDGAVRLIRRLGTGSAAGLVNAVMRRAPQRWQALEDARPGVRWSHPDWLVDRWTRNWGTEITHRVLASNQAPAPVWVWFTDPDRARALASGGDELRAHPWSPGTWMVPGPVAIREVEARRAYVQDPSSQLVSEIAGRLASARTADLCSGPGGKAARLAARTGRTPLCADRSLSRMRLVDGLFSRLGIGRPPLFVADAAAPPLRPGSLDVVVDAPCSGTGTLRRHPELRWRLAEADIAGRSEVQRRILAGAATLVGEGGWLLYATCSVEPEENEQILTPPPGGLVSSAIAELLPPRVEAERLPSGGIRLLPGPDCDGFTVHLLRRPRATR